MAGHGSAQEEDTEGGPEAQTEVRDICATDHRREAVGGRDGPRGQDSDSPAVYLDLPTASSDGGSSAPTNGEDKAAPEGHRDGAADGRVLAFDGAVPDGRAHGFREAGGWAGAGQVYPQLQRVPLCGAHGTGRNKMWDMAEWDQEIENTPWKRGWGAQKLYLSQAAGRRGKTALLISSVTGNAVVTLKEYKKKEKLCKLGMVFSVSTMDQNNHVEWNTDFGAATQAGLRNMIHNGLQKMRQDPLYPLRAMLHALTSPATNGIWRPAVPAAQVEPGDL